MSERNFWIHSFLNWTRAFSICLLFCKFFTHFSFIHWSIYVLDSYSHYKVHAFHIIYLYRYMRICSLHKHNTHSRNGQCTRLSRHDMPISLCTLFHNILYRFALIIHMLRLHLRLSIFCDTEKDGSRVILLCIQIFC